MKDQLTIIKTKLNVLCDYLVSYEGSTEDMDYVRNAINNIMAAQQLLAVAKKELNNIKDDSNN